MKMFVNAAVGGVLCAFVIVLGACSDDFGTPCNFHSSSEIEEYCGSTTTEAGNPSTSTCVDPINADCESRVCVIYQGSSAFCSKHCAEDGNCPGGSRCEHPLGATEGICIPNRYE